LHRLIAPAYWRLPSFDHLVGAADERQWNAEAERSSGLEVEYQLDFALHQTAACLFNHRVDGGEQLRRHGQPERLGGL
jgi:hypothetical protein